MPTQIFVHYLFMHTTFHASVVPPTLFFPYDLNFAQYSLITCGIFQVNEEGLLHFPLKQWT